MSDDLVLGMIGAGNIASRHLANLEFLGRNRVVGLCDLDLEKAKELSARCGAKPYANFEEMFDREPGLDAVVICTPPTVRRSIFELAIERGIGIYCELLYIDGKLDIEKTIEKVKFTASQKRLCIASGCGGNNSFWLGQIDDVGVFNVALKEGDVKSIMNEGLRKALGVGGATAVSPTGKLTTIWAVTKAQ